MKNAGILVVLLFFLSGCDNKPDNVVEQERVWGFAQFNVPEEGEKIESYYYYGLIPKPLYEAISSNNISSGFITIEQVKYWGDDDLIHEYQDAENKGDLVFRVEDVQRLKRVRIEPVTGQGVEQFEEPAEIGTNFYL